MVFIPATRDEYASKWNYLVHEVSELMEETPIATAWTLISQQIGGWPMYLITNITGHNNHSRQSEGKGKGKTNGFFQGVNHFNPSSPLYEKKDEKLILLSDLGLAITCGALFLVYKNFGFQNLLVWYLLPYLWVNHWLGKFSWSLKHRKPLTTNTTVAITFLQHTDPTLPHYTGETWTFARGAAATIDRNFWPIGPHIFHDIIETHVLHHYISTIPFYHAGEATEAIKPVMGRHYRANTEGGAVGFIKAMWTSARMCNWVEPTEGAEGEGKGVLFFRNRNGLGVPPAKIPAVVKA